MNVKFLSVLVFSLALLSCSTTSQLILYKGEPVARENVAVVSALGLYADRKLSLTVKKIDGKPVTAATEMHLLPGTYTFNIHVWHDLKPGWPVTSWKELYVDKTVTLEKGHTYVPQAILEKEGAQVTLEDKGLNYPEECNPFLLYQAKKPHDFCKK